MKAHRMVLAAMLAMFLASPAQAGPLVGIIVAAIGLSGTIATIATVILDIAFTLATSALLNAIAGKPPTQERQASTVSLAIGESPRAMIQGTAAVGGTLADVFNWGGQYGTDYECQIIVLADHKCHSLVEFWVNDNKITYPSGGFSGGVVPDSGGTVYGGLLQVYWLDGSAAQTLPSVVTNGGWSTTGNFGGLCLAVVVYKADDPKTKKPVWSGGRPSFLWVVKGKKQYDPRFDDTAGGSGAQRWTDPNSWLWTDNPAVCRYNWVRGIYAKDQVGDPKALLVGRGLSEIEAPPENVFAYANICDEAVPLLAGGTEKRYRVNGVVRSNERYVDVEQMYADATGGIVIQPGGSVEVEPGHARSPSFAITDADLIVGSKVTFERFRSAADNAWVNTVVPRYIEPTQKWQDHAAPVRRVAADVTADGGAREIGLSLAQVTGGTQAQRLGEIKRRLGRLPRNAQVPLGPRFGGIEEGDWLTWTSARYLDGDTVTFRVEAYAIDEKRQVTVTLREIASTVYDWTTADEGSEGAVAGGGTAPDPGWVNAYGTAGLVNLQLIAASYPAGDLTITGSTTAIVVSTHHRVYSDSNVSVTGATISGTFTAGSRYYVYYDDAARAGGAVSYQTTTVAATAQASDTQPYRHYVGWVVIPASGSGAGYSAASSIGNGASAQIVAAEALSAAHVCNLFTSSGAARVQKANATDTAKPANCFVLQNYASGADATVYFAGQIVTGLSGLTPGTTYWLDTTAGQITATCPAGVGNGAQIVGVALSATSLLFNPQPITGL